MFHLIIFVIITIGVVYLSFRLITPAKYGRSNTILTSIAIAVLAYMYPIYHSIEHYEHAFVGIFGRIAVFTIGVISTMLTLTLIKDCVLLILFCIKIRAAKKANRLIVFGITALALTMSLYGYYNTQNPQIVNIELPVKSSNNDLHDFKIVQITDTHITKLTYKNWFYKVVNKVNAENPDLILVTGDFADIMLPDTDSLLNAFSKLQATYGVYGVLGNHEYHGKQSKMWVETMNALGVHILENENEVINHRNAKILIAGITDNAASFAKQSLPDTHKAIANTTETDIKILMSHQPQNAIKAAEAGFDVQLSGHTHGGQFFPWNFIVDSVQDYFKGSYKVGNMSLYVNQGTGYWDIPNRLGTYSEITVIKFKFNK